MGIVISMHIVLIWLHVRIAADTCMQQKCTVPQTYA